MGEGQGWMYKAFLGHRHERSPVSDLKMSQTIEDLNVRLRDLDFIGLEKTLKDLVREVKRHVLFFRLTLSLTVRFDR